jgi:hypothetical protein
MQCQVESHRAYRETVAFGNVRRPSHTGVISLGSCGSFRFQLLGDYLVFFNLLVRLRVLLLLIDFSFVDGLFVSWLALVATCWRFMAQLATAVTLPFHLCKR